ncbi:MAG: bacillithiol system redox-active protein YtxJ [Flavobacteriales bacterium]|nr:bacillithiol system redox-active protein YtxJ [Flavobacteriales bacterium]
MKWNELKSESDLQQAVQESNNGYVLLFKHSTRCSVSFMAKKQLEMMWQNDAGITPYYLDLIAFRSISNQIAQDFGIHHESPQAILLKDEKPVQSWSHSSIQFDSIRELT